MSRRIVLLLAITVAVLGIVALPSAAGLNADDAMMATDGADQVAQSSVDCASCHEEGTALADGPENIDTCEACHDMGDYKGSIHVAGEHADTDCTTCHEPPEDGWFMHFRSGPHGDQNPEVSYAPEDTCAQAGCHGYGNESLVPEGKESGVTHVSAYHPEYGEWNETEDPGWSSDMASHSKVTPSYAQTEDCAPCHGTHEGTFANIDDEDPYGFAYDAQPSAENVSEWRVTCVACHEPHTIDPEEDAGTLRGDFDRSTDLCAQCHNTHEGHGEFTDEVQRSGSELHHSMWELYRNSKYIDNSSSHVQLECASCHMAQLDRPGHGPDAAARKMGHDFEVRTDRLEDPDLWTEDYRKCGACHQDLDATINEQEEMTEYLAEQAIEMRVSSNETLHELGYADDEELMNSWEEGRFWLNLIEAGGSSIHNPEMANERLTDAIQRFDEVKSLAYQQEVDQLEQELEDASEEPQTTTTTTTEPTETTATETPGLGIAVAMIALIGAALLAVRRWT